MNSISEHRYGALSEPLLVTEQQWADATLPLVAVNILSYNHESYIRECLDGILMQKTTFPIRICIFEDCSTDQTRSIINEYEERYPQLFRTFFQPVNTWGKGPVRKRAQRPFIESANEAKYQAVCEGDDFWTDPLKLQKQIDFLENKPAYVMTFHSASVLEGDKLNAHSAFSTIGDRDYSQRELFIDWKAATASIVYRKEILQSTLFDSITSEKDLLFGDNLVVMMAFTLGKVWGMNDNMAVYRKHSEGVSYNVDRYLVDRLTKQNVLFGKYFPTLQDAIPYVINQRYLTHLKIAIKTGNLNDVIYFLKKLAKAKLFKQG